MLLLEKALLVDKYAAILVRFRAKMPHLRLRSMAKLLVMVRC